MNLKKKSTRIKPYSKKETILKHLIRECLKSALQVVWCWRTLRIWYLNIAVYTPSASWTAENLLAGDHKPFYNWNELNPDKNVAAAAVKAVAAFQVFLTLLWFVY